jgi:hypothetical protein
VLRGSEFGFDGVVFDIASIGVRKYDGPWRALIAITSEVLRERHLGLIITIMVTGIRCFLCWVRLLTHDAACADTDARGL